MQVHCAQAHGEEEVRAIWEQFESYRLYSPAVLAQVLGIKRHRVRCRSPDFGNPNFWTNMFFPLLSPMRHHGPWAMKCHGQGFPEDFQLCPGSVGFKWRPNFHGCPRPTCDVSFERRYLVHGRRNSTSDVQELHWRQCVDQGEASASIPIDPLHPSW